jgi:hypothetical protein
MRGSLPVSGGGKKSGLVQEESKSPESHKFLVDQINFF